MKTPTASFANTSPSEPTSAKSAKSKFTKSKRNSIIAQENALASALQMKYFKPLQRFLHFQVVAAT